MKRNLLRSFQKSDQLTIKNKTYQSILSELFLFLIQNDHIHADSTSRVFLQRAVLARSKKALLVSKSTCVIAGINEVVYLLKKHTKLTSTRFVKDGSHVGIDSTVLELRGSVSDILSYERTILNILQRMSGIATETERYVSKTSSVSRPPLIAATRKTPWMHLDKKAVAVGGGVTHRLNLEDGILLKDNHLSVVQNEYRLKDESEAISYAIQHAKIVDENISVEVEVKTEKAAFVALETWQKQKRKNPLIIMFDNYTPERAKKLLDSLKRHPELVSGSRNIFFEASGGISLENIVEWAKVGVDVISIGALTHSPKAADLSLDIY